MALSFSQELQDLLNPQPRFADPEDDADEATKARVVERFNEDEEPDDADGGGALRKLTSTFSLLEADRRYVGKPVSRKQLLMDTTGYEEDDDEDEDSADEDDSVEEDADSVVDEENEDEEFRDFMQASKGSAVTLSKEVDFYKMKKGMDDLGMSDDYDDEDDDDDDDETEGSSEEEDSVVEEMEGAQDEDAVRTFSKDKLDEEVEKGKAVRNQLALWDQLLEGRIKFQKALITANQLPQPPTFPEFMRTGGAEFAGSQKNVHKALKALQRSLLELHDQLLYQNPNTRPIAVGEPQDGNRDEEVNSDDEEEGSAQDAGVSKRKLDMDEYPDFMSKRFADFESYRNATLQKWHDKTRLTAVKSSKGFGAFERSIMTQVEQVLMDNKRLVQRTQTRRSEYRVLGQEQGSAEILQNADGEVTEQQLKANAHLKDLDENIFDDDDFYHQLLRELIERRTSAADPNNQVAVGKQWLAIQKLRSKIKKKVDTKASKGRKVRFHVHSKLVNFMAPMDHSSMSDEARSKLYLSLFGQNTSARI